MLPQTNRLRKMKDIKILFKEGCFVTSQLVELKIWKIDPNKYLRRGYTKDDLLIGFVVGVKISKSAVKRNRAKRQMRETVRLLLKENRIKSGFMVMVLAKPSVLGKEYEEIEKSVMGVFKKAGLLYEN